MQQKMTFWDRIYNEFEVLFPSYAKDVVDWYPSGRMEIVIRLESGDKYIYDHTTKSLYSTGQTTITDVTEDEWKEDFAKLLSKAMRVKNMSQCELSELSGISQVTISNYVNGKRSPSVYIIAKLASALQCSVYELIGYEKDQ